VNKSETFSYILTKLKSDEQTETENIHCTRDSTL